MRDTTILRIAEKEAYDAAMRIFSMRGIPVDTAAIIMGNVHRRFLEHALDLEVQQHVDDYEEANKEPEEEEVDE